jgi:hypothetical protein
MVEPLVVMVAVEADQEFGSKDELCWSTNPAADELHERMAWLPKRVMLKGGEPGVCKAARMLQKPPVME